MVLALGLKAWGCGRSCRKLCPQCAQFFTVIFLHRGLVEFHFGNIKKNVCHVSVKEHLCLAR